MLLCFCNFSVYRFNRPAQIYRFIERTRNDGYMSTHLSIITDLFLNTTNSFFTIHNTIVITVTLRGSFTCLSTVISSFYIHQSYAQIKRKKNQCLSLSTSVHLFCVTKQAIMPILNLNVKVTVDTQLFFPCLPQCFNVIYTRCI